MAGIRESGDHESDLNSIMSKYQEESEQQVSEDLPAGPTLPLGYKGTQEVYRFCGDSLEAVKSVLDVIMKPVDGHVRE